MVQSKSLEKWEYYFFIEDKSEYRLIFLQVDVYWLKDV